MKLMDLLDVQNKLRHCFELAVKANPVLMEFGLAASTQVKVLGLSTEPDFIMYNPHYYMTNDVPESKIIQDILIMREDFIDLIYPVELRSATTTTPQ